MSAILKSGATADLLTIDPTSKAARVTQYRTDATEVNPVYTGSYMARIEIVPTTLTAATTYWSMRNLGTKRVFIRKIELKMGFAGTAAASRSLFEVGRFSAATPTAGTALTILKKDNTMAATSVTDARFAPGGLTTTSVTFETPFHLTGVTNQLTVDHAQDLEFIGEGEYSKLVLAVNEGLCIRANTAIVAGAYLVGMIAWDERT